METLLETVNRELQLSLTANEDDLHRALADAINHLIVHNLPALIQALYRMDVNENKLREALKVQPAVDAGPVMATLVIDRLNEKIRSRREHSFDAGDVEETERW